MTIATEWAEKYRPSTLADVVGNKNAVETMRIWSEEWLHGIPEKRGIILYGQAGIGKTSAAHALAKFFGWEAIELNASDQRTAEVIEKIAGSASKMRTLTGTAGKRLVILDEADNLHGTSDRGGARAIGDIIKNTNQPIILIANDLYGISSSLRGLCQEIKFNTLQSRSMVPALKNICREEGIMCGVGVIERIAENADGDLRSAVNDLQAVAMGRDEIYIEDIATSQRDTKESIFKVLAKIFKGTNPKTALEATYGLDESPEDLVHWIDENLPIQYHTKNKEGIDVDVSTGFNYLSRADMFLGRVKKRQNYRLWRYASVLMTCGTVVTKSHIHSGFVKYQPPSLWRRLGQLRTKRNMRDNISSKIGEHCHESMRYARADLTHIYSRMLKDEEYAVDVAASLNLDLDELAYMNGSKKITKKDQNIYAQARLLLADKVAKDIEFFVSPASDGATQKKKQIKLNDISYNAESVQSNEADGTENTVPKKHQRQKPQKTLFDF